MKIAMLAATLSLALAALAATASGEPAPTPPAESARSLDLGLSRMDQIMIQAQETAEWMARHHSRLELRDMNRAIERMCDRLQDAERRMGMLGEDPTVRADKARSTEVRAFGDHLSVVAKELSALHASLRKFAEPPAAPADAALQADRDAYRGRHTALMEEMNRLQKHSDEFHAWVVAKPAPRGLDEISRDLDIARQELHAALQAMDRSSAEAGLLRERLFEMDQVHARARAVLQALGEAQDRVATLASAS